MQQGSVAPSTSTQPTTPQSQMVVFPSTQQAVASPYGPQSRPDTLPLRSPQGHPLEGGATPHYQVRSTAYSRSPAPSLTPPFPLLPRPPLPPLQGASAHTPMMMSPVLSPMQQVVQSPYAQPPPGVVPPMQPATPSQQPPSVVARHPPNMVAHTPNMMSQPAPNIVAHHPNMVAPPNVVISQNAMAHLHSPHHVMQDRSLYYAPSPNPMVVPYQMGVQSPMATIAPMGTTPMSINGGFYSQTVKG